MEGTNSEPLNQANASGSRMISIIVSRLSIDSPLRTWRGKGDRFAEGKKVKYDHPRTS